jgi:nucleotide-binding universal stress UspA family protein
MRLGRQHDAQIVVQHVEPVYECVASARAFVRGIARRLRSEGLRSRAIGLAGMGCVAFQIAQAADRVDADVIVVGSRRRGDVAALLLGSVARDLLRRTARPVLLAEAPERSAAAATTPPAASESRMPEASRPRPAVAGGRTR